MAKVKLLSLNDLHNYFASTNKTAHFSSKDSNQNIVVQVNGQLRFDENNDKDIEGLLPVTLMSCHIDENVNHSSIAEDVMIKAMPSFSNRPILGFIHEVDGEPQFYSHNMHLNENNELVYDEIPIGTVPESCNARLEEYDDKKYCVVDGYIYEGYTKAAEILRREQKCDVSVELEIRELSYNAKTDILNIEDFFFSGVTILGVDEEGNKVYPGMEGANITLADFSQKNNSLFSDNSKIIELLSEMNNKLDSFNINNSTRKEEPTTVFEKLLKKYNKTEADITFEHEGLSDEELETLFKDHFETKKKKKSSDDDDSTVVSEGEGDSSGENQGQDDTNTNTSVNTDDNSGEVNTGSDNSGENTNPSGENTSGESTENTNGENNGEETGENNSGENGEENPETNENFTKTFELSHSDIRSGLYALLEPYEVEDNEWYWITAVYDDHFVYEGWSDDKIFDQKYSKDGDNIKFEGERVHLNREYLTDSELVALNEMRSNYSLIQSKLASYEAEPQKMEILESDCYAQISNLDAFKELAKQENHFSMSVEDVQTKADELLLAYAKGNKVEFSTKTSPMKVLPINKTKASKGKSRYGGTFSRSED
jgi:hypothetical protein